MTTTEEKILNLLFLLQGLTQAKQQVKDNTLTEFHRAIDKATSTVAVEFGDMEHRLNQELKNQANEQFESGTIVFELSNDIIDRLDPKTGFHTRGHPDFNPDFAGGYDKPSKPGTKPISKREIIRTIGDELSE